MKIVYEKANHKLRLKRLPCGDQFSREFPIYSKAMTWVKKELKQICEQVKSW